MNTKSQGKVSGRHRGVQGFGVVGASPSGVFQANKGSGGFLKILSPKTLCLSMVLKKIHNTWYFISKICLQYVHKGKWRSIYLFCRKITKKNTILLSYYTLLHKTFKYLYYVYNLGEVL